MPFRVCLLVMSLGRWMCYLGKGTVRALRIRMGVGGEEQLDRTAHLAPYSYEAIASTVACILW